MNIAIIMAGGKGTRFWPLSTKDRPKQLLDLVSDKTMLEETVIRIEKTKLYDDIFIVTGENLKDKIEKILPNAKVLTEPFSKDTSFCITYALKEISKIYGDNINVSIFPADHLIKDTKNFKKSIELAMTYDKNIVIMGIKPTYPETAYGYIKYEGHDVLEFREKPNLETAEKYLEEGNYLWNSGMLFAKAKVILAEIQKFLPDHYMLNENSSNVSFDIGVLEKTKLCKVIPVSYDWNDVGSFNSLTKVFPKDENGTVAITANYLGLASKNNIVINKEKDKTIVLVGLDDLIVVNTENEILICPKSKDQEIKKITGLLDEKK